MAVLLLIEHETILSGYEFIAKRHFIIIGWKLLYINYQGILFWYHLESGWINGIKTNNISVLQLYSKYFRVEFHSSELKLIITIRKQSIFEFIHYSITFWLFDRKWTEWIDISHPFRTINDS